MKKTPSTTLITFAVLVFLSLLGFSVAVFNARLQSPSPSADGLEASYVRLSPDELVDGARAIFTGSVLSVGPTRWNQDSGEPWLPEPPAPQAAVPSSPIAVPIPLHFVEVAVDEVFVDEIGLPRVVNITVLGSSPSDADSDDTLTKDLEGMFFMIDTQIAWRDGTRAAYRFLTIPGESLFTLGRDNLYHHPLQTTPLSFSDLLASIAARRPIILDTP